MRLLLAGDSTVAKYQGRYGEMTGWGEALETLLAEKYPKLTVLNFAKAGASTRSFEEEGLFAQLIAQVEPTDLVLIQFGHNDQNPTKKVPMNDYFHFIKRWIHQIKEKGGQAILCTPVERRHFVSGEQQATLKEYERVLRRLAKEEEVTLLPLNRYTNQLYQRLGERKSRALFIHPAPGDAIFPVGNVDDTHFSTVGAAQVARYVCLRLADFLSTAPLFNQYYYGACMYPEVWSKEVMETDVKHLQALKMNFARIGEFVWSALEPEEGQYDFTLLEEALTLYQENGIDVCLCIPTPTPPRWLTYEHPERLITNIDGTKMVHGSRQHVCTNNAYFREKAYQLTQKIAAFSKKYENVIAIQLDNEFKCHVDLCYCDTCQARWHEWLAEEYLEIENLNAAWGTKIWSEEYHSFAEVVLPKTTPFLHHASLMNAFRRFTAETLNEFAHELTHCIRIETDLPVTHNTSFGFNLLNEELFSELDVVGFDTYPAASNYPAFLLNMDTWRNVKKNQQDMLLLETSTSHAGHLENYVQPHPAGYLVNEVFTGFAGGLKSFSYWHFRGHRYGVEQPHSCVVTAWGEPDKGYEDVKKSGELIEKMRPFLEQSTFVPSKIAIVYSDHAKRHYNVESGGIYQHRSLVTDCFASLIYQGIQAEVIQETSDFSTFDLLMIPFVRHLSPILLEKIKAFVQQGGKLILGPMTGDRTEELAWPKTNGLDILGEWLEIKNVTQYVANDTVDYMTYENQKAPLSGLLTTFSVGETWETLAQTNEGKTILATKKQGKGSVTYIGGLPKNYTDNPLWQAYLAKEITPFEKSASSISLNKGLVKYCRETKTHLQIYLANMTGKEENFTLHKDAIDLLTGVRYCKEKHNVLPYGHHILAIEKD